MSIKNRPFNPDRAGISPHLHIRHNAFMHVDLIRLPESLMDPGDQPDAVSLIQFRQKLPGFLIPACQRIHGVLTRIVDENLTVLIDPVVFYGQLHPVKQDPVEQFCICG